MSDFLKDFEKANPEPTPPKENTPPENNSVSMTFQDMKDYFDGMKESLINEMKSEMLKYKTPELENPEPESIKTEEDK